MAWDDWVFIGMLVIFFIIGKLITKEAKGTSKRDAKRKRDAYKRNASMLENMDEINNDIMNKTK